jgi:carboxylesterase type B
MIFIHGGAYETGYSAEYGLLGLIRNFASKNIVLVHFQYRLGVLGIELFQYD